MTTKVLEKEIDIQRAILDYLSFKNIFHYRNNTGAFVDSKKHFYRFGMPGSPDIIAIVQGRYIGIEVKGVKGKQTEKQEEFEGNLTLAGGVYILARSLDDVVTSLTALGAI